MTASTTEQTVEVAGLQVRWLKVIVSGHTVQQVLLYDVAEAEAVHGRPFDEELDYEIQMAMFAVDRIWADETMHKVASATSYVLDGKCIRTAKIEHCNDIEPGSASWVITRADGTPVETEPWSCVPGTPPISHVELTSHLGDLHYEGVPLAVAAALESEARLDKYMHEWTAGVERALARLEDHEHPEVIVSEQAAGETLIVMRSLPRFVTKPSGQQVPIDDEGWGLTKSGRRDLRYKEPIGPPLP